VADLVAQVAEDGPVGLIELCPGPLALDGVGLGEIEGDDAVGVAGRHRLVRAREHVEGQAAVDRQAELEQLEHEPALGRLGRGELRECLVGRPRAGERAGAAEPAAVRAAVAADQVAVRAAVAEPVDRPHGPVEGQQRAAVEALRVLERDEMPADRAREGAHRLRAWHGF
jgi:hypothetical protein